MPEMSGEMRVDQRFPLGERSRQRFRAIRHDDAGFIADNELLLSSLNRNRSRALFAGLLQGRPRP